MKPLDFSSSNDSTGTISQTGPELRNEKALILVPDEEIHILASAFLTGLGVRYIGHAHPGSEISMLNKFEPDYIVVHWDKPSFLQLAQIRAIQSIAHLDPKVLIICKKGPRDDVIEMVNEYVPHLKLAWTSYPLSFSKFDLSMSELFAEIDEAKAS